MRLIDLTGQRFGKLIVVERASVPRQGTYWRCKCDCGNEKTVYGGSLKNGATKSCGCIQRKYQKDITGQRFGRLIALHRYFGGDKGNRWVCQCDCGNKSVVAYHDLVRSDSKCSRSCGCLKRDLTIKRTRKHGLSKHRLYAIYNNMIKRCESKQHHCYENYGGRGIKVCPEWRKDFLVFYKWAISNGYESNLTLDRIDNDKGYSPQNCRWVTRVFQQNHRRDNNLLTFNGETRTLTEWARIVGIKNSTIRGRLKSGWSVEDALTIKPNCKNSYTKQKAI